MAAEMPRNAMNTSKMCVTDGTVQLQVVVVRCPQKPMLPHTAASVP